MEKKKVTIIVAGESATGKTHVIFILKKFLRTLGFDVELEPSVDYPTEVEFHKYASSRTADINETIQERSKIILKERNVIHTMRDNADDILKSPIFSNTSKASEPVFPNSEIEQFFEDHLNLFIKWTKEAKTKEARDKCIDSCSTISFLKVLWKDKIENLVVVYRNIKTEEGYNALLNSGMLFELHPELSGVWEMDKVTIKERRQEIMNEMLNK